MHFIWNWILLKNELGILKVLVWMSCFHWTMKMTKKLVLFIKNYISVLKSVSYLPGMNTLFLTLTFKTCPSAEKHRIFGIFIQMTFEAQKRQFTRKTFRWRKKCSWVSFLSEFVKLGLLILKFISSDRSFYWSPTLFIFI